MERFTQKITFVPFFFFFYLEFSSKNLVKRKTQIQRWLVKFDISDMDCHWSLCLLQTMISNLRQHLCILDQRCPILLLEDQCFNMSQQSCLKVSKLEDLDWLVQMRLIRTKAKLCTTVGLQEKNWTPLVLTQLVLLLYNY